MKTREQIDERDKKELEFRKNQNGKKALKYGFACTLIALFLASVVDEISSSIGTQIQSSVVTEFFVRPLNIPYNEAMAMFSTATTFSYALMALVPFYKALADKIGRKPFLVFNTFGMGMGMALACWSPNMVVYFIGYGMTVFFVQHDMQIVYLYEIVPKEKRATIYGLIKGISTLGIVLIPMLRSSVMGTDTSLWRGVYIIPAVIVGAGFVGDKLGRKTIVSVCGALAVLGFISFNVSAWLTGSPYLVGIFYGLYLGCWWITLDYVGMMVAESAPTYNRGSVLGAVNLITMVGSGLGSIVPIFAVLLFDKIGFGYMTAVMPFAFIGVLLLIFKVKETKGVDLDKVTY